MSFGLTGFVAFGFAFGFGFGFDDPGFTDFDAADFGAYGLAV